MIANVENISMGPPNPGGSMGEKTFNKSIAQSDMEAAEIRKQKLLIRRNETPDDSFQE